MLISFIRTACAQKIGFSNAELLQDTDWDRVQIDPHRANPKLPKWIFSHDPEAYVYENYDEVVQAIRAGAKYITDVGSLPANYPPGYKYEAWSIEKIMKDVRAGKPVELGDGRWD